ncbi:MAG: 3'(2'),5'-bisphosphate nucleotidase CysQ [Thiohalomonadales bacterium]
MMIKETLKKVVEIAVKAGDAIIEVYNSDNFDVQTKGDNSPLTRADLTAHHIIVGALEQLTPEIPVLSEESSTIPYEERKHWTKFWLVDPLDGTKEFIKRNGEFTVNIALIDNQKPVMGVVYAPVLNRTYYAAENIGAYVQYEGNQAQEIHVADYRQQQLKVVASRSHAGPDLQRFLDKIGDYSVISMGSSLKLCLVAEGKAHLYPRLGPTMEWDTAASHAVVNAAGGQVTNLEKESLVYNKENLLNPYFMVCGEPAYEWDIILNK